MSWKDFLYFQRGSKVAVILLIILIVLTLILNAFIYNINSSEIKLQYNDSIVNEFKALSVQKRTSVQSPKKEDSNQRNEYKNSFNSNFNGDVEVLKSNSDKSYIKIEKLSAGQTISLNSSDTAQWKKIPGIGSSYASRIVKYRALLGGFVDKQQLMEVYGIDTEMYSQISPYIEEDSNCDKLKVNVLQFKELLRHPYLNYDQVKVITNLIEKKGRINSINELEMFEEFTSDDISRLQPYLDF
jgi:DNA uptake protein ComE-like DNA-binding protein